MFNQSSALAALALLGLGTAAQAQVAVTVDGGTTGTGIHLVVPMESSLNGRFGFNTFKHDLDRTSNGIDYDIKGRLRTFDVLFDWYAIEGSAFHVTAGLVYNGNAFDVRAKTNGAGDLKLNGTTYSGANLGILTGHMDYRKAAPYLGIGWGNPLARNSRWSFNGDLGAFYQGRPNLQLNSVGCSAAAAVCKTLVNDVAAERLNLQKDVNKLKFYPVLRASIGYRF